MLSGVPRLWPPLNSTLATHMVRPSAILRGTISVPTILDHLYRCKPCLSTPDTFDRDPEDSGPNPCRRIR
jgi:hypothetical protein